MRHLSLLLERHAKLVRARDLRAHPTPSEARAWQLLRQKRIGGLRFRRQHVFGRFILDFYCPAKRIAIEIDGSVHESETQLAYDTSRDEVLTSLGLTVIRIRNNEVSEESLTAALSPFVDHPPPHEMGRG